MFTLQSARLLTEQIDAYFKYITGEYHIEQIPAKTGRSKTNITEKIVWDRMPEPASITGLALFLGFNTRQDFEAYERRGKCRVQLKKAILRVEYEYEKRLLLPSPAGAIFALKSMGWTDKPAGKKYQTELKVFRIVINEAGPLLATTEKEVVV